MLSQLSRERLLRWTVVLAIMGPTVFLALWGGVVEKSWWDKFWDMIIGGGGGALAGLAYFVVFGAIGWVSGPLFGAIGIIGLMVSGALGGLGLGAIVHMIRNPQDFEFYWSIMIPILAIGSGSAWFLSSRVVRRFGQQLVPYSEGAAPTSIPSPPSLPPQDAPPKS